MKLYKVKVNGKVYEVELESVTEKSGTIAAPAAPVAPVAPVAPAAPAAPVAPAAPAAGDVTIVSPMQGTILDVNGKILAVSEKVDTISINPSRIKKENKELVKNFTQENSREGMYILFLMTLVTFYYLL